MAVQRVDRKDHDDDRQDNDQKEQAVEIQRDRSDQGEHKTAFGDQVANTGLCGTLRPRYDSSIGNKSLQKNTFLHFMIFDAPIFAQSQGVS